MVSSIANLGIGRAAMDALSRPTSTANTRLAPLRAYPVNPPVDAPTSRQTVISISTRLPFQRARQLDARARQRVRGRAATRRRLECSRMVQYLLVMAGRGPFNRGLRPRAASNRPRSDQQHIPRLREGACSGYPWPAQLVCTRAHRGQPLGGHAHASLERAQIMQMSAVRACVTSGAAMRSSA